MHSQQQVSRTGLLAIGLAIVVLGGCTTLEKPSNPVSSSSSSEQPSLASTQVEAETPDANRTAKEQFATILGTKQDGWLPKVIAGRGLKKGLTPAMAGKIIPGAEQVSEFGFSKVAVQNVPGLKQYEFYYAKNGEAAQLESVKLQFDPNLNEAYADLVEVATQKYGAAKPEDIEQQAIVWVGSDFVTAQLTKPLTSFDGYVLNISLAKD
ncbi:MAG: hypothetical protein KME15_28050 [Drouetiella hepatica Uher 2000/2452]|jgi:hypothetical protein|uniref:Uncharacterized protein n=1 Tax=Drouetiella hepatica Uher 2000/2452 TaxID=904376 RepID=A0A951QHI6_9CYAN|nr:hypothetical protein [Drouetiella hepatica Uher 2000/2452]